MDEAVQARDALAAAEAARARMAGAADCPPARHAAFGALMGGVTAAQALPGPWILAGDLAVVALGVGLYLHDRASQGVWLNGYRRGATRRVTVALLAVFLLAYSGSVFLKLRFGWAEAPVVGGGLTAVAAYVASRRWSRAYRREMEARL